MIKLDYLDRMNIFRRCLVSRCDCLKNPSTLNILLVVRSYKSCNALSVLLRMRLLKHSLCFTAIYKHLNILISEGYLRRSGGKGTTFSITLAGLQALQEFNTDLVRTGYTRLPSHSLGDKRLKRPKPL